MLSEQYPFTLPPLPYAYHALEPYIDTRTMEIHHNRHFKTYIDNLNNALKDCPRLQKLDLYSILKRAPKMMEQTAQTALKNAGGVFNHNFYFSGLRPKTDAENLPSGNLFFAIQRQYQSFNDFKTAFTQAALSVFGSGWAYLVKGKNGCLAIRTYPNQECPISQGFIPVLCCDVWEHAYYLKYQNQRAAYIASWWNIVNWEQANENYLAKSVINM